MQVFRSIRLIILLFLLPGGCDFPPSSWDGRTKIAITFDDQHESVYTVALPMMQEYGFRATNFINTAHMGMTGCYGWTEAEELELVHGWETGGHTLHHYNLPTLDPETLEQEIYQDWLNLKDHGLSHESFALPAGHATEEQFLLINRYYRNIRTSRDMHLYYPVNRTLLGYASFDSHYTSADIISRIISGIQNKEALIIIGFHMVSSDPQGFPFNCPPGEFQIIMQFIYDNNIEVLTIKEAMEMMAS